MVRDEPSNIRSSKRRTIIEISNIDEIWRSPHLHKPEPNRATKSGSMFAEVPELPSRPHTRREPWMRAGRFAFGSYGSHRSWRKNWGKHGNTRNWSQTRAVLKPGNLMLVSWKSSWLSGSLCVSNRLAVEQYPSLPESCWHLEFPTRELFGPGSFGWLPWAGSRRDRGTASWDSS